MTMIIEYDRNPNATIDQKISSLKDSVQRALEEVGANTQSQNKEIVKNHQSNDSHYTHVQESASRVWTVTHNLNKNPAVSVVDSAGTVVIGDVQYIDLNTVKITFQAAFGGKAFFN